MPNSDNTNGVHNKITNIYSRASSGDSTTFADVAAAKAHLLSAAALTIIDECATQVEWEAVSNTGFKVTMAFGTKGTGTAEDDDWTAQFHSRKKALESKKGPFNVSAMAFDHTDSGNDEATVTAASHTFIAGEKVVFDSLGGFTGTAAEGNMNESSSTSIASVSGNDFVTGPTMNLGTKTYTNGGTVTSVDDAWQKNGSTWADSSDHLF